MQEMFVRHAPTFLGEMRDPDLLQIDVGALAAVPVPMLLSSGTASAPMFAPIVVRLVDALPDLRRYTFAKSGHVPHLTDPNEYVSSITDWAIS